MCSRQQPSLLTHRQQQNKSSRWMASSNERRNICRVLQWRRLIHRRQEEMSCTRRRRRTKLRLISTTAGLSSPAPFHIIIRLEQQLCVPRPPRSFIAYASQQSIGELLRDVLGCFLCVLSAFHHTRDRRRGNLPPHKRENSRNCFFLLLDTLPVD